MDLSLSLSLSLSLLHDDLSHTAFYINRISRAKITFVETVSVIHSFILFEIRVSVWVSVEPLRVLETCATMTCEENHGQGYESFQLQSHSVNKCFYSECRHKQEEAI